MNVEKATMNVSTTSQEQRFLETIRDIRSDLDKYPDLEFNCLNKEETIILFVDMINGFAVEGPLASPRVGDLIEPMAQLLKHSEGIKKVFLCDRHQEHSGEFGSYLPHAIQGTEEALIVKELYELQDMQTSVIFKNSTNGMMTKEMRNYFEAHPQVKNYIIIGNCTDICILQFALSLKAYYNEMNLSKNIIVPMSLVDTFNLVETRHDADLMNLFAFYNMKMNGIDLYQNIVF